jgi:hypothetical protein
MQAPSCQPVSVDGVQTSGTRQDPAGTYNACAEIMTNVMPRKILFLLLVVVIAMAAGGCDIPLWIPGM